MAHLRTLSSLRSLAPPASLAFVIAAALGYCVAFAPRAASADVSSLSSSPVTVYGAKWCSACRTLEAGLEVRKIAFEVIDVDDNPSAFSRARAASGASNGIPLTSVVRISGGTTWIVGADIDAVDRATKSD